MMKRYYYTDGTNRFGPFTFKELRSKNITRYTLIWSEGMVNWTAAAHVPELQDLFSMSGSGNSVPPPIPDSRKSQELDFEVYIQRASNTPLSGAEQPFITDLPPKNWMAESILVTIFCCLPFGVVGIVHAAKVDSAYRSGNMTEAQEASINAKKWTMYSLWSGITIFVLYILLMVGGIIAGNHL